MPCGMIVQHIAQSFTGYMPTKLMYGEKLGMTTKNVITSWNVLPWEEEISREELLALRIRQLERRPEDIELATTCLKESRLQPLG